MSGSSEYGNHVVHPHIPQAEVQGFSNWLNHVFLLQLSVEPAQT